MLTVRYRLIAATQAAATKVAQWSSRSWRGMGYSSFQARLRLIRLLQ
jgi:hypothetical protein